MYSVFIADDEYRVINGLLKRVDWEGLDARVAGFAQNGNEARQKILDLRPDIVITDILMPGLTGLQVIKAVKEEVPSVFIIFSGYSEFEYARSAIQLEALEYLIKPVDIPEIERAIRKAEERSDLQKRPAQVMRMPRGVVEEELLKFMGGEAADPTPFAEYESFFVLQFEFGRQAAAQEQDAFVAALRALSSGYHQLYFIRDKRLLTVVNAVSYSGRADDCRRMVTRTVSREQETCPGRFYWGLGCLVGSPRELPVSLAAAGEMLAYCKFIGEQIGEKIKLNAAGEAPPVARVADGLVYSETEAEQHLLVNEFLGTMVDGQFTANRIKAMCCELYYAILSARAKAGEGTEGLPASDGEFLVQLMGAGDIGKLRELLIGLAREVYEGGRLYRGSHRTRLIGVIKDYVDQNIGRNISLEDIAMAVNMNPAYISYIFKQESGQNLFEYITQVRIEQARHLLKTTCSRIFEISHAVGYDDPRYFCQVFKKRTGMTAMEYRNSVGGTAAADAGDE